ncbi:MAG: hypothetical protein LBK95_18090 [Bifidobacteriaceae bacterium]|nr:hypothetical protein [Bifidobacteriaceae bacterium]
MKVVCHPQAFGFWTVRVPGRADAVMVSIAPVVLLTEDPGLAESATAAIWEAGVPVQRASSPVQLVQLVARPLVVVCGHDLDSSECAAVGEALPGCRVVRAALGEKAWGTSQCLALPESARHLTRLVEAAYRPAAPVTRVALIGAHGGAGTSCLAVALALRLSGRGAVRLAGLNRAGAPIGPLLGLDGSSGWDGPAPQTVRGVELLSGDAPPGDLEAWQVRRALEAWEGRAPGGHTVLDAGPAAPGGAWRAASWADRRLVVARSDPSGAAALTSLARELGELGFDFDVAVRAVRGGLDAAETTHGIGGEVIVIGDERGFVAGLAHGLTPGDRARGKLAAAAGRVADWVGRGEPERVPQRRRAAREQRPSERSSREPQRRERRPRQRDPLPTFNPAAFAEEW